MLLHLRPSTRVCPTTRPAPKPAARPTLPGRLAQAPTTSAEAQQSWQAASSSRGVSRWPPRSAPPPPPPPPRRAERPTSPAFGTVAGPACASGFEKTAEGLARLTPKAGRPSPTGPGASPTQARDSASRSRTRPPPAGPPFLWSGAQGRGAEAGWQEPRSAARRARPRWSGLRFPAGRLGAGRRQQARPPGSGLGANRANRAATRAALPLAGRTRPSGAGTGRTCLQPPELARASPDQRPPPSALVQALQSKGRGREVRGRPNRKPRSLRCPPLLPAAGQPRFQRAQKGRKAETGSHSTPSPRRRRPNIPVKRRRRRRKSRGKGGGWLRGGSIPKAAGGGRRAGSPWLLAERPGFLGRGRRCPGPPPSGGA